MISEDTLEWRLSEIENKYSDFKNKNDEEHKEFLEFYHRLDKDMAIMAIKVGSITGAAASVVTWILSLLLQKVAGVL